MVSAVNPTDVTVAFGSGPDSEVLNEAYKRFSRCAEWEASARERFLGDYKFANGDADNGYQWPDAIRRSRDVDIKPCLTLNVVKQHNFQVVNAMRQGKSGIRIAAAGNGATKEAADAWMGLIRHIEYQSQAQEAYIRAAQFQVDAGIGWWRLVTDWVDEESFDQEIFILPVQDPLSVYVDPDAQRLTKTDARFAFVFDNVPIDQFEEAYPRFMDKVGLQPFGVSAGDGDWISKDHIRLGEYFRKVQTKDQLASFVDPTDGGRKTIRKSFLTPEIWKELLEDSHTRVRDTWQEDVEWKLIAGDRVIDSTVWLGKYIPLIPVIGEELVLEGVMDRKGLTRSMKDAQRMFNYNASSQVEQVALQGKTPWMAPAKAIEEFETYWNTANTVNHSVLPWNHMDDDGNEVPAPVRQEPPKSSEAYQSGMDTAFNQMMMVSGQWQNQMGMQGNERTGAAINARQGQGDTATFHFQDNFAAAIITTGIFIVDLGPRVYDTRRAIRIQAEDGEDMELQLDPGAKRAFQAEQARVAGGVRRVLNPALGKYDVMAQVGAAYGTKRQETQEALKLLMAENPALTGIVGDLFVGSLDFDKADEAAMRLKRMVPPQALGQGPSQQEQALQQQVQALQQALQQSLQKQAAGHLKLVGKEQMRDIDVYKAETDRLKAMLPDLGLDPAGLQALVQQLVQESLGTSLQPIIKANADELEAETPDEGDDSAEGPPVPGAERAPDGEWYLEDPTRRGKYLQVAPLVQKRRKPGIIANA